MAPRRRLRPSVVPPTTSWRNDDHGVGSSSTLGIVDRVRLGETSNVHCNLAGFRSGTT